MIGIALIFVVGAYVWIAKKAVAAAWQRSGKLAALWLAFFILAPTVDAVGGRLVLKARCERESSVRITERTSNVEGFRATRGTSDDSPEYWGYKFVEGPDFLDQKSSQTRVDRAVRASNGGISSIEHGVPSISKYQLTEGPRVRSWYYFDTAHVAVSEIATGRELSSFDWIEFRGGWAERFVSSFSDAGPGIASTCAAPKMKYEMTRKMLHETLQPETF